jgi:peptidyl-dipeptidase A
MASSRAPAPLRLALLAGLLLMASATRPDTRSPEARAKDFIGWYEETMHPLVKASGLAAWKASNSGKDADFKAREKADNALDHALSSPEKFREAAALNQIVAEGKIQDPLVARQIQKFYLSMLGKAVDPKLLKAINAKASGAERKYNNYRAVVRGKKLSSGDVYDTLVTSKDSALLRETWEASKGVGVVVEKDLRELVRLRNKAAKALGFANFHAMSLAQREQNGDDLVKLFDELDTLTRNSFISVKKEIDGLLAARLGIKPDELMPWHYQNPFFQEAPSELLPADFDGPFEKADVVRLGGDFYRGIGLPVDDVIKRSDMYAREGKDQEAFAMDIDQEGDVRTLQNVLPNAYWMDTTLHELGHTTYMSTYIPRALPWGLREDAHTIMTEGLAMMMGRLARHPAWIQAMGLHIDNPKAFGADYRKRQRWDLLVFSRWTQVMLRFEKAMYENPEQDLNALWWTLVERYQMIRRPPGRNAPDYAAKSHIVSSPVYYHNYELGEFFASQLRNAIAKATGVKNPRDAVFVGDPRVGAYLKEHLMNLGAQFRWDEAVKRATGEPLSSKAFAEDLKEP